MAIFKEWPGIRYIMQLMIINLVACLACLSAIAFAQLEFSEAVTGSVTFPDGAIASLGNLAVFFTSLLRGRLDLENGARDILATNRGPKLQKIEKFGLTTCDVGVKTEDGTKLEDAKVVMLSKELSDLNSIKQFMKYIQHSHGVDSILIKCLDLQSAVKSEGVTTEPCTGGCRDQPCGCIVLWTEEEKIGLMIARRMPGTLKRLCGSLCLLPCSDCLRNGCHGCNQGLLHVKQTEKDSKAESPQRRGSKFGRFPLQSADVKAEPCRDQFHECKCNVLWRDEEIIRMMVAEFPRGCKRLSNSLCLRPSQDCLERGCHGLLQTEEDYTTESPERHAEPKPKQALREEEPKEEIVELVVLEKTEAESRLKEEDSKAESRAEIRVDVEETPRLRLTEEGSKVESPAAVCGMLEFNGWRFGLHKSACICIPLCEGGDDEWTKLMIRFMRSKDQVAREVRVIASDAMETYINGNGEISTDTGMLGESYSGWALIVQRLIEVAVNIVATVWLRVDGLSSSLIARRVVRDHLVDSKGTGFHAHAFLSGSGVLCNQRGVCQVLRFRGNVLRVRTVSYAVSCVNLIVAMSWCLRMACEGRYGIHSMAPSKPRVIVMLASIALALLMDFPLFLTAVLGVEEGWLKRIMVLGMIVLEIVYVVTGSVMVVKGMGMGRWLYSAFQLLIWVKWGIRSYLLGDRDDRVDSDQKFRQRPRVGVVWRTRVGVVACGGVRYAGDWLSNGFMTYSSAFMLNAILAGVRGNWKN